MAKRKGQSRAKSQKKQSSMSGLVVLIGVIVGIAVVINVANNPSNRQAKTNTSPIPTATISIRATVTPRPSTRSNNETASQFEVTPMRVTNYQAISRANARSCPQITCDLLGLLDSGAVAGVDGVVSGDMVSGSRVWYRTRVNNRVSYVHSSLLTQEVLISTQNLSVPTRTWDCAQDVYSCDSFSSRAEMDAYWRACPGDPSDLDGNEDGEYCESR